MSVRTSTYRHVPTCTMLSYVQVRTTWKMSHDGTGRYILVRTSTEKCPKVRTRTYLTAYRAVQGSIERYRAVHEMVQDSTCQIPTRYKAVHGGTCQYTICNCGGLRAGGQGGLILVRFRNRCIDCTNLNSGFCFKSLHAQTRLFIPWYSCQRLPCHRPPLCHPRPPRWRLAMPLQAPRQPRPQLLVAASHPDPRPHRRPRPAGGRQEGRQHLVAKWRLS